MNTNRNVLRSTQNRLALKEISTNKKKTQVDFSSCQQQENVWSQNSFRPILTATRSVKKLFQTDENNEPMLISPPIIKTREELEDDLYVL